MRDAPTHAASTHQCVDGFWHLRQREVIIQKMPISYSNLVQLKDCASSCMLWQTHSSLYSEPPQGASRDASFPTRVVKRLFLDVSTGRLFTEQMFIYSSSYIFDERIRLKSVNDIVESNGRWETYLVWFRKSCWESDQILKEHSIHCLWTNTTWTDRR
jgi:hypothetical protein